MPSLLDTLLGRAINTPDAGPQKPYQMDVDDYAKQQSDLHNSYVARLQNEHMEEKRKLMKLVEPGQGDSLQKFLELHDRRRQNDMNDNFQLKNQRIDEAVSGHMLPSELLGSLNGANFSDYELPKEKRRR